MKFWQELICRHFRNRVCPRGRLQGKLDDHVNQFFFRYHIVVIGIEPSEDVAAEANFLLMQQAFDQGNEFAPGNDAITVLVKDLE